MAAIDRNRAPPQPGRARRATPALFGIAFGLAGLGEAWHAAGPVLGTPGVVPDAGATDALLWLTATRAPGATAYAVVVIVLITALIAGIAARTVLAAARGQLLAPRPLAAGPEAARPDE